MTRRRRHVAPLDEALQQQPSSTHTESSEQHMAPVSWRARFARASLLEKTLLWVLAHIKAILVLVIVVVLFLFGDNVENSLPTGLLVDDLNRPGLQFDQSIIQKRHPVILVPGFITTALELWEGKPCSSRGTWSFRQRMFSAQTFWNVLSDPECFLRHFSLDPLTGGDPPGVKVRPDSSFSSADYLLFGFWVWAKLIVNLADIGYDPNSMHIASYDWRLDAATTERRDKFFSRLMAHMEVTFNGSEKFVIVGHSYGCNMIQEFLVFADQKTVGWSETYVEAFFDIGGPFLGVPKALAAMLSGEVKDTALLPSAFRSLLDSHLEKPKRTYAFRTWLCLASLLPRGGDSIWPSVANLDDGNSNSSLSASAALSLLGGLLNSTGHQASLEVTRLRGTQALPTLPTAPSLSVYCVYGVGLPSEVEYWFRNDTIRGEHWWGLNSDHSVADWTHQLLGRGTIHGGVGLADGDGTVPLTSLGYVCRSPRGFSSTVGRVVTIEVPHAPASVMDIRGGVATADHVDIMGNYEVIRSLLHVVTGNGRLLKDHIESQIDEIVADIEAQ